MASDAALSDPRRILLALKEARARIEAAERWRREPIAIIGVGCRWPDADGPDEFWRLLHDGVDAMREVPAERWDVDAYYDPDASTPGKTYVRQAGFLDGVDQFDPHFFGISPREAVSLDPQQRLLLEVSWEALEHAGLVPERLAGSATGVYVGISSSDYALLALRLGLEGLDAHFSTGNGFNTAAGRLSHHFGFRGPCLAVDTACSSALVAVHLACQSLRTGESDLALAGGVNLILAPDTTVALSRMRLLAPDGRCKTFSAAADGMARGEGCGMILLRRLSDALQHGDRILALIRGSATNHDGPSSGFTVPNGLAQEDVIRRALDNAGVRADEVSYLEAHGTGTALGDPIEIGAATAVYGAGRSPGQPLVVGSVKTNFGHLEAAAGLAGLVKVVLALQHGEIPPHLHFDTPNPHIPWPNLPIRVPVHNLPWPAGEAPRRAGVSSFGLSGTNAHVVVEEAPATPPRAAEEPQAHLLLLSVKSDAALAALAARWAAHLAAHPDLSWGDACYTARVGRTHFRHRLSLVAASVTEAREKLEAFAAGQLPDGVLVGEVSTLPHPPTPSRKDEGGRIASRDEGSTESIPPSSFILHPFDGPGGEALRHWGEAYVRGADVDWSGLDLNAGGRKVTLPAYPFQRQRYWLDSLRLVPATAPVGQRAPDARSARMLGQAGQQYPRPPLATPLVAPRNEFEAGLAELWQNVLGLQQVGVHDDFYELGGDSVLAAQIVAKLRTTQAADLTISRFLEAATVARLAEALTAISPAASPMPTPAADAQPPEPPTSEPFPLSPDQARLWLLDRLFPGNAAYHVPAALRLRGPLDAGALEKSFNTLLRRHSALRLAFHSTGGAPAQVILPWAERQIERADLSSLPLDERWARAQALADEEARAPFDLARGPLARLRLVGLDDADHLLLLTVHHIAADAWSVGIALKDLLLEYAALVAGQPGGTAEEVPQFYEYLQWQQAELPKVLEEHLAYWRGQLAQPTPVIRLPADRPRPALPTLRGGHYFFSIPAELHAALQGLSRRGRCSLFVTLLAAFDVLLFRCSGQTDLLVGCPVANRARPEMAQMVGFLANTLVLRADLSGDPTFAELLQRVREVAHAAYDHQDVPFANVVEAVHPKRAANTNPLFQVMFNMVPVVEPPPGPVATEFINQSPGASDYDLFLTLWEGAATARGALGYSADLFDPETAAALTEGLLAILEAVGADPEVRISDIALPETLRARLRAAETPEDGPALVVAATFTAEPVEATLAFWFRELGLPFRVVFAPYHQVLQQLLDPTQALRRNQDGVNLLLVRFADWLRDDPAPAAEAQAKQSRLLDELTQAIEAAARQTAAPLLVYPCPAEAPADRAEFEGELARRLAQALAPLPNVYVVQPEAVAERYPVPAVFDRQADRLGHVPFTPEYFAALGTSIARNVSALRRVPFKVLAVDCDNTLWHGVCGEDGPEGVTLDAARRRFQEFLVAQVQAGWLLCLCSKNNPEDVWAVFDRGPAMPLRREHVAASRLNWQPKPDNLRALAEELGLGLDSFIFIDDSPLECAEVRAGCPAVLTLPFSAEPGAVEALIGHTWAFDRMRVTAEDRQRTELYRQDARRRQAQAEAFSLNVFLAGLQLHVDIAPAAAADMARVEQLMFRTNQFNATTRRLTHAEIARWIENGGDCLTVRVRDRFGDYGLVGVMLCLDEADSLLADGFLLSCRALGRGVEHQMLAHLGRLAQARGLAWLEARCLPSARNAPVRDFLDALEATSKVPDGPGLRYRLAADTAAALVYRPEVAEGLSRAPASEDPAPTAVRAEAALLSRIPHSLRRVEDILQAVRQTTGAPAPARSATYTVPKTQLEHAIATIWGRVLGVERVGLYDNFFDLGGHSLLLVQVSSELQAALQREVPLVALFQYPTVEALARHLAQGPAASRTLALGLQRGQRQRELLAQRRRTG